MKCPACGRSLVAKVIQTRWDGELNLLKCGCGYTQPIPQSSMMTIQAFRASVSQMMGVAA